METVALVVVTLGALVAFTALVALVALGTSPMPPTPATAPPPAPDLSRDDGPRAPTQNVHISLGPSLCPCPDCTSNQGPMFAPGCPAPYGPGQGPSGNPHAGKDDNDGYLTDD